MINHLMMFIDEQSAAVALPSYCTIEEVTGTIVWDSSKIIPNQRIILQRAEYSYDNWGVLTETVPEFRVMGYFLTVTAKELNIDLRDMPGGHCRVVGDGDTGELLYVAPDVDIQLLSTAIVEPVLAGMHYGFITSGTGEENA